MFDYFKKMKQTQHEAEENEPQESKPKKDIVFYNYPHYVRSNNCSRLNYGYQ